MCFQGEYIVLKVEKEHVTEAATTKDADEKNTIMDNDGYSPN